MVVVLLLELVELVGLGSHQTLLAQVSLELVVVVVRLVPPVMKLKVLAVLAVAVPVAITRLVLLAH
jgi:hypothetical protein